MFSEDTGYGRSGWYKQLGGLRKLTNRDIEDALFSPENYRSRSHNEVVDIFRGYDKLREIRNIPISYE